MSTSTIEELGPISAFISLKETLEEANKELLNTLQELRQGHKGQKDESYLYSTMPFTHRTDRILEVTDQLQKNQNALIKKAEEIIEFVKSKGEIQD